jgi:hypothetical protein
MIFLIWRVSVTSVSRAHPTGWIGCCCPLHQHVEREALESTRPAPAPRQYVRGRLIEMIERHALRVTETELEALYAQIMAEHEVPLLETL